MAKEYIEREATYNAIVNNYTTDEQLRDLDGIPAADVVEVCRCKDCKHRPTKPEKYDDGFDLVFPDEVCSCHCDSDPYYSWYPKDDWFCPNGERREDGGGDN